MILRRFNMHSFYLVLLWMFIPKEFIGASGGMLTLGHKFTMFQDFKAVLMYFSEPFLKGASFGGKSLEGETFPNIPIKLIQTLESLKVDQAGNRDPRRLKHLMSFKSQLQAGLEIAAKINRITFEPFCLVKNSEEMLSEALKIQNGIIETLKSGEGVVIPSGWRGHAIALIIKVTEKDGNMYDLTVVNTGEGLGHHYHRGDPDLVYPHLSRLWLEFKNIPEAEIFDSKSSWLICGLAAIQQNKFIENLQKDTKDEGKALPNYFYDSLLANFVNYLVSPDETGTEIDTKLAPEQQSGSCTMSSLMGALLYHSESIEDYHWFRLKIGHILLDEFLKSLNNPIISPDKQSFLENLSNGFFHTGILRFKGLIRALAIQQLQYLEHKYPDEFKHAGLIGSGRSSWLNEKKDLAIAVLSACESTKLEILTTIRLAASVHKIASTITFRPDTTRIASRKELLLDNVNLDKNVLINEKEADFDNVEILNLTASTEGNNLHVLSGKPERLVTSNAPINTFKEFYESFEELFDMEDFNKKVYFMRFLDIFKRLRAGSGWELIFKHTGKVELIKLQTWCKSLAIKFLSSAGTSSNKELHKPTLDEITFLGHLQLLSWNLFRSIHMLIFPESTTDWSKLLPPQTLQNMLFAGNNGHNFISGNFPVLPLKGFNDIDNYKLYQSFLQDGGGPESAGNNYFPGPESFLVAFYSFLSKPELFSKVETNKNLFDGIFNHFMQLDSVNGILARLRRSEDAQKWSEISDNLAKFLIVLYAGQNELLSEIPHFYNMMHLLFSIRIVIKFGKVGLMSDDFWIKSPNFDFLMLQFFHPNDGRTLPVNVGSNHFLKSIETSKCPSDIFYLFRHYGALPLSVGVTDIDTWFNYIKCARTAKIFDAPYFQYITDHLLNVPKYTAGNIEVLLFNKEYAESIINELIALVHSTLKELHDISGKMTKLRRSLIVTRAVNVSVIITRFISRVDYEFDDSSHVWAVLMAKLYNTLEPYSYMNSETFSLIDSDISMLNLALGLMSNVSWKESGIFMNCIDLGFDYSFKRVKKALARFHWFIAKMSYTFSNNETIADDQYKYGFIWTPLCDDEAKFLESLLKEKYLRNYVGDGYVYSFHYESDGHVLKITYSKSSTDPEAIILINLVSGVVINNGVVMVGKSLFINSYEFKTLFNPRDHDLLAKIGKLTFFSGVPVFFLPNFNGSDYFIIRLDGAFWILREWNGDRYVWRPEIFHDHFYIPLDYTWAGNRVKLFKKYTANDQQFVEMIIFDDDARDPFMQIIENRSVSQFKISIPGLTDGISATVLNKDNFVEMHIKAFAEEGISYAAIESFDILLVVFNSYRFPEEPSKPLVLMSSEDKILVKNMTKMEICKDQRIGKDGFSLPGSLVASTDGKKELLLPLAEVLKKSSCEQNTSRPYIHIQRIPIVENSNGTTIAIPVPQSRMHKLLLAYYMILSQNFDEARRLLHPSTSFNHNEMLSKDEIQIIIWILRIKMKAPEFNAIKLLVISHFLINEANFVFEYGKDVLEVVNEVKKYDPRNLFELSMMSIREIPEKYYIFKIFPEILGENSILSNIFLQPTRPLVPQSSESRSKDFDMPWNFVDSQDKYEFGKLLDFDDFGIYMKKINPINANLMRNLLIRTSSTIGYAKGLQMATYCYITDPEIWSKFKTLFLVNEKKIYNIHSQLADEFRNSINACLASFSNQFNGVSLAELSLKTQSLEMKKTWGELECDAYEIHSVVPIVKEGEIKDMLDFGTLAMERIRSKGSGDDTLALKDENLTFDAVLTESSKVLGSLSRSISRYISEFGKTRLNDGFKFEDEVELKSKLKKLNDTFSARIVAITAHQKSLTEDLMAETYPEINESKHSNIIEHLFSMMHSRKKKRFSDLYTCYLRNSLSCIQKKFPQLDFTQCEHLKAKASVFFSQQILLDYFTMLQKSSSDFLIPSKLVQVDDLLIFCDELAKISEFDTRIQHPVIMNFEFRSRKYRLKSEQVDDIDLLTAEETNNNFTSVVIQRMMAAGKTLVLGTISVVTKALKHGDRLSILVPPSSLYQSNATAMQNRTYQYFKKKGNSFIFSRLPLSKDAPILAYLDNIIDIISNTMKSRNYLILSPDHLHSFMNSYIEAINNVEVLFKLDNSYCINVLKRFATIYQIFKTKSSIILDEIDMTMDPKKELNYPTLDTETYNMTAVAMLADIIEFMLFDKNIKEAGLNIHSNNQGSLTPKSYIACRAIVLKYIGTHLGIETSVWHKFVPETYADNVMAFLSAESMSHGTDSLFAEEHTKELANALIIVKTQLYLHFEEFLSKTVNQNYGCSGSSRPEIKYAIPYVAANTPSTNSIFADRWETLIKTLLMISAAPCAVETAKNVVEYVRKAMKKESAGTFGGKINESPTFTNIEMLLPEDIFPLDLDENNEYHISFLHNVLMDRTPAAIRILFGYYISEVLSKMEFPVEQITSNALNVTSMFASVQGYSGTIDNVNILPFQVVEKSHEDHEKNEKYNGGIALKLINDSNNATVAELSDESFVKTESNLMKDFMNSFKEEDTWIQEVSAIIDTGAFFKNFTNRNVSEAILIFLWRQNRDCPVLQ